MDALPSEFWTVLPLFAVLGCVVGFLAGLLGIGGGGILVPALYYSGVHLLGDSLPQNELMHAALATSMAVIIPTGLSSSYAQIKRKAVEWNAFSRVAPALVFGVIVGVYAVSEMKSSALQIVFAVGLYFLSALIFFKKEGGVTHQVLLRPFVSYPAASLIGLFSTLVGIGGASLNVPYLARAGVPLHRAIATSSVLGVAISIPAAVGLIGFVYWLAWVLIVPFSVLCAPMGVRASHALPVSKLKIVFAILLCLIATKMAFDVVVP
ncbi:MAG TPA: sulfite exporter TauE/SafE family protein [Alphaproteobacteria bacterium]|nr:sulfite exporter TauE/SafE family protein [Alphaproteobacteria bacterium]HNS43904.1 sulfite exporter TauE/SafE family protein [Alphaproteobacteria bacterium]